MDNNSYQNNSYQQPPQYGYDPNQPPQYGYGQPPYGAPQESYPPYPPMRPKTKSGFLTFCLAFVPGAGDMYLGHMKRGMSLAALFFGTCFLSMLVGAVAIFLPVIWMYSFFDTFNLRGRIAAGTADADDYMFHLSSYAAFQKILEKRSRLIGWALIVLGAWAVYDSFLMNLVFDLCDMLGNYFLYDALNNLPSLVVIVAMILLGVRLVRGPQQRGFVAGPEDDIQYYTANTDSMGAAPSAPADTDQPEMGFAPDAPASDKPFDGGEMQ